MNVITSTTVFNDAVGKRMSITYSVVDEVTGKITADNKRIDRVVTDPDTIALIDSLTAHGQAFVSQL